MDIKAMLPTLDGIGPTKETLHLYSKAVSEVPRVYAQAHPKWLHIALDVTEQGLETRPFNLPDGRPLQLALNLEQHVLTICAGEERAATFDLTAGWSSTRMGAAILETLAGLGLTDPLPTERFASDVPRQYDPDAAQRIHQALKISHAVFKEHAKIMMTGEVGEINFWPHNFDLSQEWFGTRQVAYEKNGETHMAPAQLNLGLSFGDDTHPAPYYYSNPFPFEPERLLHHPLPEGAVWVQNRWHGTLLPYVEIQNDAQCKARLLAYADTVYHVAEPILDGA